MKKLIFLLSFFVSKTALQAQVVVPYSASTLYEHMQAVNVSMQRDFSEGWNMLGFPCVTELSVDLALENIVDKVLIVKDNNGAVYMPEFNFNGIGNFELMHGYQIKLSQAINEYSICEFFELPDAVMGCTDWQATNFNQLANTDNGSCLYEPLQIGDFTQGGIVFYIDETGEHGLVAAMNDLEETVDWGCFGVYVDGVDDIVIGTGLQNTLAIIQQGCSSQSGLTIAAQIALDYEIEGYTDWYLPSKDELSEMHDQIGQGSTLGNIGTFENDWYWSSSEFNNNSAWVLNLGSGFVDFQYKSTANKVRVIRAF